MSSYENDGVIRFPTRSRSTSDSAVSSSAGAGASRKGESKQSTEELAASSGATPLHASTKKVYSNAHAYHINSLATNSDGQTFVSSDDLRINWWSMDVSDTCFSKSIVVLLQCIYL